MEIVLYKNTPAPLSKKTIEAVVFLVAQHEKKLQGVVEVSCVDSRTIRHINREYRGKDKSTDVISFADNQQTKKQPLFVLPHKQVQIGYVYVCPSYIKQQAERFKVAYKEEFVRMLVHGLLHVAGHDHDTAKAAKSMFGVQEKVVQQFFSHR